MKTLPNVEFDRLRSALDKNSLVVCLGPGISAAAGLPTRGEFVGAAIQAARDLAVPVSSRKLQAIEQQLASEADYTVLLGALEDACGRPALAQVVTQVLARNLIDPPSCAPAPVLGVLGVLARLASHLHLVVDTNLDRLGLRAFEAAGTGWPGHYALRRSSAARSRRVVKLCGDLQQGRELWLATREDLSRAALRPAFKNFATALLCGHVVLFLGFRADDPVLDWFVGLAPGAFDQDEPPQHIALVPPSAAMALARKPWAKRGVTLLPLGSGEEDHIDTVCELLQRLAPEVTSGVGVGSGVDAGATLREDAEGSPYPGLERFDEDRAAFFFGRDVDVDDALTRLEDDPEDRRSRG